MTLPGDIWQHLETFLVVITVGGGGELLASGGEDLRGCSIPHSTEDSPTTRDSQPQCQYAQVQKPVLSPMLMFTL